jgi:predicted XRE-type DNA-binding protein
VEIYKNLDVNDLDGEVWKVIEDFPDYYISNLGRVKSFKKCRGVDYRILKQTEDANGYFIVGLSKNGKVKNKYIHRLMYEAFKEKLEKGYDAHHINGDTKYNFIENLESKPHGKHSSDHKKGEKHPNFGKHHSKETKIKMSDNHANFKGEKSPNSKLTEEQVIQIKLLLKEGKLTQQEIADMFGVCQTTISNIKHRRIWSNIEI